MHLLMRMMDARVTRGMMVGVVRMERCGECTCSCVAASGGAPAGLSLSSLTEIGEFWMLLSAQSMALGTIMVRCAAPTHMHVRAWR